MKRILLVNPPGTEQSGFTNPPLGLLYLAGTLIKEGFEVRITDGCVEGEGGVERALSDFRPEIVGITCLTPARGQALRAAELAKKAINGVITVLGGVHSTLMYSQILEHYPSVDFVVLGEGERTLLEIAQGRPARSIDGLAYREGGKIVLTAPRKYQEDLDDIPLPAWHLIKIGSYPARGNGVFNGVDLSREPRVSVIFSRGCTGHCDFCSTWRIWRGWRRRSAGGMADEIELLYRDFGIRHFAFADDCLTVDRHAAIELCDEITARGLRIAFHATTRTNCVDETVLQKLKEAGCYTIAFGVETGSPRLLTKMGKMNDVATSERAVLLCKRVGLKVAVLLITGSVGETWETLKETMDFLKRTRPDEIGSVGGLWVLPGTKLYRMCVERGLIDDSFWLGDSPYMIYTAEYSLEELEIMRMMMLGYDAPFPLMRARVKSMVGRARRLCGGKGDAARRNAEREAQ